MYQEIDANDGWYFHPGFEDAFLQADYDYSAWQQVDLPHSPHQFGIGYRQELSYEGFSTYRRAFSVAKKAEQLLSLHFDGIANSAKFYCNGELVGFSKGAYLPYTLDLGTLHAFDLTVVVDATEDPAFPPFGGSMDYLSFCGIYRLVTLVVTEKEHLTFLSVSSKSDTSVQLQGRAVDSDALGVTALLYDGRSLLARSESTIENGSFSLAFEELKLRRWSLDDPYLYTMHIKLADKDQRMIRFGSRSAEFRADGFYLNGSKLKLVGLNRHQDYPYLGYAAPPSLQREDARLLKQLGVNLVRTSHYPQDCSFLSACDELGLLVFEEIPGWQHIGKEAGWRSACLENTRAMIERDCNHPSIILWGVRINESADDRQLYEATNALAHEIDPHRQTGGVRNLKHSEFLEDVYTYNDFSYAGKGRGLMKKSKICSKDAPYLVSEYCGHIYPAKRFDPPMMRSEHALRHYQILDAAASTKGLSGAIGWCMHDYYTHANFGSGDQICYHGVLDLARNPKAAAYAYQSQLDGPPMVCVLSSMEGGDHPNACLDQAVVATNCEAVRLWYNDDLVGIFHPDRKKFPHLAHSPVIIRDFIGERLKAESYLNERQRKSLSRLLGKVGRQAVKLTMLDTLKMGLFLMRHRKNYGDAVRLFSTYVGNWGSKEAVWRFEGLIDNEVAAVEVLRAGIKPDLRLLSSSTDLSLGLSTYDMAAVRLQVVKKGQQLPLSYANIAFAVSIDGPLALSSPDTDCTIGGSAVVYVRTVGKAGKATLTVHSNLGDTTLSFTVR